MSGGEEKRRESLTIGHYTLSEFHNGSFWLEDDDTGEATEVSNIQLCAWVEKLFKETM